MSIKPLLIAFAALTLIAITLSSLRRPALEANKDAKLEQFGPLIPVTEEDIKWDKDTRKFKKEIVLILNKIREENKYCRHPILPLLAKSDRSTSIEPIFYITCDPGDEIFNIFFKPKDAGGGKSFAAIEPISSLEASNRCERVAKEIAQHPSSVDFSRIFSFSYKSWKSGRVIVQSTFTAKNIFGLQSKFEIECVFDGEALISRSVREIK